MKRIFMLSTQSLFGLGVEILLRQDADMQLIGAETDIDRAIERIQVLCPDVILLDQDSAERDLETTVMRILKVMPSIKVVGLSLTDNTIHVYRGEQVIPREIGDLLQLIKNDPWQERSANS